MRVLIKLLFVIFFSELSFAQTDTLFFNTKDGKSFPIEINSIKKITFSTYTSVKDKMESSGVISELKNIPNPAETSTQFSFVLNEQGNVKIIIYNIQGREISTIEVKDCKKGENTIQWDCKDSNNNKIVHGIYIYEVIFKDIHITKKMIILD